MRWHLSHRADPDARQLADRHYSRQSVGAAQFVPPGRCLVLKMPGAYWVTSAPYPQFVKHSWAGAWMCSAFRKEDACPHRASDLITEAVAATRWYFGDPPALGMVTFVDAAKVRPTMVRGAPVWGWTYTKAGFRRVGETQGGLLAFQLLPADMPDPEGPLGAERLQWETMVMDLAG